MNGIEPSGELRFAELVARSWLEPELAERYRSDARSVLAELGITLSPEEKPPLLPTGPADELSVEELDSPFLGSAKNTFQICIMDEYVAPAAQPALV